MARERVRRRRFPSLIGLQAYLRWRGHLVFQGGDSRAGCDTSAGVQAKGATELDRRQDGSATSKREMGGIGGAWRWGVLVV